MVFKKRMDSSLYLRTQFSLVSVRKEEIGFSVPYDKT